MLTDLALTPVTTDELEDFGVDPGLRDGLGGWYRGFGGELYRVTRAHLAFCALDDDHDGRCASNHPHVPWCGLPDSHPGRCVRRSS